MADEMTGGGGMPDAASVMTQTISEFQAGGANGSPESSPVPPATQDAPPQDPAQPAEPTNDQQAEGQTQNWYEQLLAQDGQQTDELAALLNQEAFDGLAQNPDQLSDWAKRAFGHLQKYSEGAERERNLAGGFEYIGGQDNAQQAFDLFGDIYRGNIALDEPDGNFPDARNYAERGIMRILQNDPDTAYALGTAVLNLAPELLTANRDYLLHVLGYDPKYADDYKRVAESGGYNPSVDDTAIQEWFRAGNVPIDQVATLRRLPSKVQNDILNGDIEAGKFHLEQYHEQFNAKDRAEQARQQRVTQETDRVNFEATKTLGSEQRKVFDEYVEKGKALGLDPLQAAGAAALAYAEIESGYWKDGSNARRVVDTWHTNIKNGNKLQIDSGRSGYRKEFELAFRNALSQFKPNRPGVPANAPNQQRANPAPTSGNGQPQITTPTNNNVQPYRSSEDDMYEVMSKFGYQVPARR